MRTGTRLLAKWEASLCLQPWTSWSQLLQYKEATFGASSHALIANDSHSYSSASCRELPSLLCQVLIYPRPAWYEWHLSSGRCYPDRSLHRLNLSDGSHANSSTHLTMAPGADIGVADQEHTTGKVSLDYKSAPVEQIAEAGEVPDCFMRASPVTPADGESKKTLEPPVIDLGKYVSGDDASKADIRAKVALACEEWGFFQVVNHGASSSLLDEGMDVVRRFYALPVEKKLKCAIKAGTRNWSGYGRMGQTAVPGIGFDWSDSFCHHDPLWHGPAEGHEWPDEPADYIETTKKWEQEIRKVASVLHEILSTNLGLPTATALEEIFTMAPVRTIYYPPCSSPSHVLGMNSHTDASSINIVHQSGSVAALQILHEGEWVSISPVTGALVINVGDCLEVMSNGKYKSVQHRAAVNSKTQRISLVMGFRPPPDTLLTPFPQTIDEDHPLLYRSLTFHEHIQLRSGLPMEQVKPYVNSKILLSYPQAGLEASLDAQST